jgi:predicted nucleic acid binding AN1-type Zn finger protein
MINGHTTPIFVENSHERPFSIIPKANTYGFLTKKWSPLEIQECDIWQGNICVVRCTSLWSMINGNTTPIFVENSHERPFSIIPKANTYGFLTKKWSPLEIQEHDLWQGHICGVRCTSLWSMINCEHNPHFCRKIHERPFSIIPKANTYGFLTKKWSPPEIQECDLWQENICGVKCSSLLSMINGHTTPIFVENSHERPFSRTLKANTYGFLTKKWSPP